MKIVSSVSTSLIALLLIYVLIVNSPTSCLAQHHSVMRAYPAGNWSTQSFLCEKGFPVDDCKTAIEILKQHLQVFPVAQLGTWTWVLVKPDHWKDLGEDIGLDSVSPAYTCIEDRLTLIDESMLVQTDAHRNAELIRKFDLSLPKLIDFAVTHELGHALCGFKDEYKADAVGKRLREGELPYCSVPVKTREKFPVTLQADVWGTTHTPLDAASK